jgi:Protein of unknown function (DUF2505)
VNVTAQIRYAADPATAFAMLVDEGFQEQVCRATGSTGYEVAVDRSGARADAGATIRTTRELPTDQFPDFVQKFVGSTVHVERVDTWQAAAPDGSRDGTIVVEIKGAPVRLTGTLRLRAEGPATVEDVQGDLKAAVPLVGGRIEKAVEPPIRAAVATEEKVGARWLAR